MGNRAKQTALIFRRARLKKGYSQQTVAARANTYVRAYQRLEYGERDLANASMKLGLSVCRVLELDPFALVLGDPEDSDEN